MLLFILEIRGGEKVFWLQIHIRVLLIHLKARAQLQKVAWVLEILLFTAPFLAMQHAIALTCIQERTGEKPKCSECVTNKNIACTIKTFKGMQNMYSAINVSCKLWWGYNFTFEHAGVHNWALANNTHRSNTKSFLICSGIFSKSSGQWEEHLYVILDYIYTYIYMFIYM